MSLKTPEKAKGQSVFSYLDSLKSRDLLLYSDSSESFSDDCISENEANQEAKNQEASGKQINPNNEEDYFKSECYDYFRNFEGSAKFSSRGNDENFQRSKNENNENLNKKELKDKKVLYKTKAEFNGKDFIHLDVLGSGAYAEVVKVRHKKTLEIYAMKIIDKCLLDKEERLFQIFVENEFLNILNHPNIIKIFGTFEERDKMHLVLEYVPNGTLASFIEKVSPMPDNIMIFFVAQIVSIIEYLASKNIVHRDLKPENFVVDNKFNLKLIDFATGCYPDCFFDEDTYKYLSEDEFNKLSEKKKFNFLKNQSSQGTPNYMPPEIINNSLKSGTYSDLWSLGCIIYDMVYGTPPFKDKTEYLVFENINNLNYVFPEEKPISPDLKDLIQKLLKIDPQERISISEINRHKFFEGFEAAKIQQDLKHTFSPNNRYKRDSIANEIFTSFFHGNSFISKTPKLSCNVFEKMNKSEVNLINSNYKQNIYYDKGCNITKTMNENNNENTNKNYLKKYNKNNCEDSFDDNADRVTNFTSSNNVSNICSDISSNLTTYLNSNVNSNSINIKNNNSNNNNTRKYYCGKESNSNQTYFSTNNLSKNNNNNYINSKCENKYVDGPSKINRVLSKKHSKKSGKFPQSTRGQKRECITEEFSVNDTDSDYYEEEENVEEFAKDYLDDEHENVFVPSHHFDVRIPGNCLKIKNCFC